jgi:hypothetical protein
VTEEIDLKTAQRSLLAKAKLINELESELSKQRGIYRAFHNLVVVLGGNPDNSPNDPESDRVPQTIPLGLPITFQEVLHDSIPAKGFEFTIDDICNAMTPRFPSIKRETVYGMIYKLREEGFLVSVSKGSRGNPARYARA